MTLNPFKIIFFIDRTLVKLETFIMSASLIGLLLLAFLQVILRNFFDSGIHWADVFNRLMVLWVGMFAATVAAKTNLHLSLEVLTKFLPDRFKTIVNVFVNIFVIVVCGFLANASWLFFQDQIMFESADVLFEGLPKAYFSVIFPIGFSLLAWRYTVKICEEIYKIGGGDKVYKQMSTTSESIDISVQIKL